MYVFILFLFLSELYCSVLQKKKKKIRKFGLTDATNIRTPGAGCYKYRWYKYNDLSNLIIFCATSPCILFTEKYKVIYLNAFWLQIVTAGNCTDVL